MGHVSRISSRVNGTIFHGVDAYKKDPRVLSEDLLDQKFPRKPRESEVLPSIPENIQSQNENLSYVDDRSPNPPLLLRLAYEMFFCIQALFLIRLLLLRHSSLPFRGASFPDYVAAVSLGVVFLLARNQSLSSEIGRILIKVFLSHNLTLLLMTVYEGVKPVDSIGFQSRLQSAVGALHLFWVICGILAIRIIPSD